MNRLFHNKKNMDEILIFQNQNVSSKPIVLDESVFRGSERAL